jgi:hypothetical protein
MQESINSELARENSRSSELTEPVPHRDWHISHSSLCVSTSTKTIHPAGQGGAKAFTLRHLDAALD